MRTSFLISGIAHAGVIGWVFWGGIFSSVPPKIDVREVSVVSAQAYDALLAAQTPPDPEVNLSSLVPVTDDIEADLSVPQPDSAIEPTDQPAPAQRPPDPDTLPAPVAPAPPEPEIQQRPAEPTAPAPQAAPAPQLPPKTARPRPATRPEPSQLTSTQAPVAPAPISPEITQNPDAPGAAVQSARPPARPVTFTNEQDAVRAALAAAQQDIQSASTSPSLAQTPAAPPLSTGERDALRVAVSSCWNVGSLSTAALSVTVVVAFDMAQDGKPISGSIRLEEYDGGSKEAANLAYDAARRAILRCGVGGFDLPVDKYDSWRQIEMTFNPERMQSR